MILFVFSFDAVSKPPFRADGEVLDEVPLLFAGGVQDDGEGLGLGGFHGLVWDDGCIERSRPGVTEGTGE
jgi:hypothetical protein